MPPKRDLMNDSTNPERKYGRLTVIDYAPNIGINPAWKCQCECGKIVNVAGRSLVSKTKKSCGCAYEESKQNAATLYLTRGLWRTPEQQTAFSIYNGSSKKSYNKGSMIFMDFWILSKFHCLYCNSEPINERNTYDEDEVMTSDYYTYGFFKYNGLDRVDNSIKQHNIDNLVVSCKYCNSGKLDRTLEQFVNWVESLYFHTQHLRNDPDVLNTIITERTNFHNSMGLQPQVGKRERRKKSNSSARATAHKAFAPNKTNDEEKGYNDGNLRFDDFFALCQENCYWCGALPSNNKKLVKRVNMTPEELADGYFHYNGLDRLIGGKSKHDLDNVVPACKFCNAAHNKRSVPEFLTWIERAYIHTQKMVKIMQEAGYDFSTIHGNYLKVFYPKVILSGKTKADHESDYQGEDLKYSELIPPGDVNTQYGERIIHDPQAITVEKTIILI